MANICFKGTTGATLQPGEQLTEDSAGNRTANREYVMDESELAGFLSSNPRGTEHPTYTGIYLSGKNWTITGGECRVTLTYTGKEEGDYPEGGGTLVGRGIVSKSAEVTDNAEAKAYTIQYLAPTAQVTWVSFSDVKSPQKLNLTDMAASLTTFEATQAIKDATKIAAAVPVEGDPPNGVDFLTEGTDYEVKVFPDGFSTQQISGDGTRWTVSETWAAVIVNKE